MVCGAVSVFFLILALIIFIVRRKQYIQISDDYDMSYDEESTEVVYKSPNADNSNIYNDMSTDIDNDFTDDNDTSNFDYSSMQI